MGQFTSFAEILENKLRKELEAALRAELQDGQQRPARAAAPSFQPDVISLLLGRVAPVQGSFQSKAKLYHQHRPKVRPQAPPKPAHKLSEAQSAAYQQFLSWGFALADNFSHKDLKAAFRKRALKDHPDQGGSAQAFLHLQECFTLLTQVFNK